MSLETHVCPHLPVDGHQFSWPQGKRRGPDEWHQRTCGEQVTYREGSSGSKAVPACCTPASLEMPAGLKLNTHLAHITSYPSKIFHYHSIGDIKGSVIATTLQDELSTLGAVRVGKSSVLVCFHLVLDFPSSPLGDLLTCRYGLALSPSLIESLMLLTLH